MAPLALEETQITEKDPDTGKYQTIPALHPKRKEDRYFVIYRPPPQHDDRALEEEFLDRAHFVADDLDWLLSLPHDKFWCQVIFDETLQKCLESYLRFAPRSYDERSPSKPAVMDVQNRIHHSVFLTFLRMSTYKESKVIFAFSGKCSSFLQVSS